MRLHWRRDSDSYVSVIGRSRFFSFVFFFAFFVVGFLCLFLLGLFPFAVDLLRFVALVLGSEPKTLRSASTDCGVPRSTTQQLYAYKCACCFHAFFAFSLAFFFVVAKSFASHNFFGVDGPLLVLRLQTMCDVTVEEEGVVVVKTLLKTMLRKNVHGLSVAKSIQQLVQEVAQVRVLASYAIRHHIISTLKHEQDQRQSQQPNNTEFVLPTFPFPNFSISQKYISKAQYFVRNPDKPLKHPVPNWAWTLRDAVRCTLTHSPFTSIHADFFDSAVGRVLENEAKMLAVNAATHSRLHITKALSQWITLNIDASLPTDAAPSKRKRKQLINSLKFQLLAYGVGNVLPVPVMKKFTVIHQALVDQNLLCNIYFHFFA